jgi:prepilin-type N-terminal cleavage/methylation domain-containing protein
MPRYRCRSAKGMTFVELIIVIVVVSILGAVVVVSLSSKSTYAVATQADQMRRDISHLQILATSWRVPLRLTTAYDSGVAQYYYKVTCQAAQSGTPCANATPGTTVPVDPATGLTFQIYLTDGVSLTQPTTLDFDSVGRPSSGSNLVTTDQDYQLSLSGTTVHVYVRAITGYAETG